MSGETDPRISELRERLAENDVQIVAAFNARLELVRRLKQLKEELGVDFHDPAREQWLLAHLSAHNAGPLSDDGLRELHRELLDLTKREVAG